MTKAHGLPRTSMCRQSIKQRQSWVVLDGRGPHRFVCYRQPPEAHSMLVVTQDEKQLQHRTPSTQSPFPHLSQATVSVCSRAGSCTVAKCHTFCCHGPKGPAPGSHVDWRRADQCRALPLTWLQANTVVNVRTASSSAELNLPSPLLAT